MRSATVEIDKVIGTQWPPGQVQHGGNIHSLQSIYEAAGITLDVVQDDGELPVPETGANFDLALLHAYMTRHRKPERSGWYAHILVVPNIEYVESWNVTRPLGVMYDFRSADLNNIPREGCAMSMRAVEGDPRIYLRTLAHELGHVFNLLHPKHENPPLPIGTTLMNQTMDLQALGAFPENIDFSFSDPNRAWLREGPAPFVMPGGQPFAERPEDATDVARDVRTESTDGLELVISTKAEKVELGEPLYLRVTLRNTSNRVIRVDSGLSVAGGTVDVWITSPGLRERRFRPVVTACQNANPVDLEPGKEILASEAIFFGAKGHSFPAPGTYGIRARYQSRGAGYAVVSAWSRRETVTVLSPSSAADVDIADALSTPSTALFLILRGGDHLPGAEETLRRIVDEVPERAVSQHARLALATQTLQQPEPDAGAALELLSGVKPDVLDRTHRAEHLRLEGLARAVAGDESGASIAVDALTELAKTSRPAESDQIRRGTEGWIEESRKTKQRRRGRE
jgi:hypothetical protein